MTTIVTITQPPIITVTPDEQVVTVSITEQPPTAVTIASGVRTFANLSDTLFTDLQEGDVPTYDAVSGQWLNEAVAVEVVADVTELTTNTGDAGEMVRVAGAGGLEYRTTAQVLADIGAETAGAAATVQGNLNTHTADTANPHTVTASQLGLVIGTDVQAWSQNLADIAGLAPGAGEDGYSVVWDDGAGAFVLTEVTGGGGGAWGGITGTLADQTDLQTALNARVADTGDTMTGALVIDGSADATQLLVEGHSTQTASAVLFRASDGTTRWFETKGNGDSIVGARLWFTPSGPTSTWPYIAADAVDGGGNDRTIKINSANGLILQDSTGNKLQMRPSSAWSIPAGFGFAIPGGTQLTFGLTDPNILVQARVQARISSQGLGLATTAHHIDIYSQSVNVAAFDGRGRFGIGPTAPATMSAIIHADQSSATGAIPVLYLDQADVSEEILEIVSTAGVGNAIELVGAKTLTVTEFMKVTVNGATRYVPLGTIA